MKISLCSATEVYDFVTVSRTERLQNRGDCIFAQAEQLTRTLQLRIQKRPLMLKAFSASARHAVLHSYNL